MKWLVIGRYKPGRYPLWGSMYLRWWFVEQVIRIFGKGIFTDEVPIIGHHLVRFISLIARLMHSFGKIFFKYVILKYILLAFMPFAQVRLYYLLMGAKIGLNVKIHRDARLGQADLLTIGDDVCIDNAIVRPFSLEEGHFVLLPISIGSRCSVGVKTTVAAGAVVPTG